MAACTLSSYLGAWHSAPSVPAFCHGSLVVNRMFGMWMDFQSAISYRKQLHQLYSTVQPHQFSDDCTVYVEAVASDNPSGQEPKPARCRRRECPAASGTVSGPPA